MRCHANIICNAGLSRLRTWLAAILLVGSGSVAHSAATVLNFEDITPPALVSTQYATNGVLFDNAWLDTDSSAHSGTRVLNVRQPGGEIFTAVPFQFTFTSAQKRVKFFSESPGFASTGTLSAFDVNGALVASDGPKLVSADNFNTAFEVVAPTATIVRVVLLIENSTFHAIDDLEFEGDPPPPPPIVPPVVTITTPQNGVDRDSDTLDIAGTVTGEGLLSRVTLTVQFRRPPEQSSAPTFTSELSLVGMGTTREFSLTGFTGLPLGPVTVTVTAGNSGGLTGSSASTFTNLPVEIRDRFTAEGGAAALGEFSFGIYGDGCKIAVYELGAISLPSTGAPTFLSSGLIFQKWLSLRSSSDTDGFGCIDSDERTGPSGRRVQDFGGGRIYLIISGANVVAVMVPAVFVDAIEKRGGETATGVPTGDPVAPVEPLTKTWLYQQFARTDRADLLPSTIEIRGTPPKLWLERQSGDMQVETTGAVWESFDCDGNQGPCNVEPRPTEFPPIENAGDTFCGGTALADDKVGTVLSPRREWTPVLGDFVGTPLIGAVIDSHLADEDFYGSHQWSYNCPFETVRPDCPSDWNVIVKPLAITHKGVAPHASIFAAGNPDEVEIEYERFYGDFVEWMERPAKGDLFFAIGRWIIDCGHATFRSELHPIFMFAKMKTVRTITDPFTGLVNQNPFNGQPAIRADLWVNGWWPGDLMEVDLYPPPRPTPTATLIVNKPIDRDAVRGITMEYSLEPPDAPSHVHLRFTAPPLTPHVTVWGEMIWQINRGYEGQWYLYWRP